MIYMAAGKMPLPLTVEEILNDITSCSSNDIVFQADNQGSTTVNSPIVNTEVKDLSVSELYDHVYKLMRECDQLKTNLDLVQQDNMKVNKLKECIANSMARLQTDSSMLEKDD